jgi:hypothetical protein
MPDLTLKRETEPGSETPSYRVSSDGTEVGRVYKEEPNGQWLTDPNVGRFDNRESAVHAVATG